MRALLAAPSTAGAMTFTLSTPSATLSTRSTAERGVRRTAKRTLEKLNVSEGAPDAGDDLHEAESTSRVRVTLARRPRPPPPPPSRSGAVSSQVSPTGPVRL